MPATTSAATALIVRHGFLIMVASFGVLLKGGPEGLGISTTQRPGLFAVFCLVSRLSVLPNLDGLEDYRDDSEDQFGAKHHSPFTIFFLVVHLSPALHPL